MKYNRCTKHLRSKRRVERVAIPVELNTCPLSSYFLSGYLSCVEDPTNFPQDEFPELFQRYENIFDTALHILGITKESLKARSDFNFDSGDAANLEGGIAILRVIEVLRREGFLEVSLVTPNKGTPSADLTCEKMGIKCVVR